VNKKHFDIYDTYRGIAALAVVLFHYSSRHDPNFLYLEPYIFNFEFGHYGVQFFFVISGYFMMLTAQSSSNMLDFLIKRFSRLWPPLLACSCITFVFLQVFGLPERARSLTDLVASNLMLVDIFGNWVDGAYWSLLVEVKYYFIFSLIYYSRVSSPFFTICLLYLFSLVVRLVGSVIEVNELAAVADILLISQHLPWFCLGIAIFYWAVNGSFFLILVACSIFCFEVLLSDNPAEISVVWLICLGLMLLGEKIKVQSVPYALRFFGMVSYPLYLLHQYIGFIIIRESALFIDSDLLRLIFAFLIVLIFSYCIHALVELRINRTVRMFLTTKLLPMVSSDFKKNISRDL